MNDIVEKRQEATGFFPTPFYYAFRSIFIPVTRFLIWAHITPNTVTYFSLVLGFSMGVLFAMDKLFLGMIFGLAVSTVLTLIVVPTVYVLFAEKFSMPVPASVNKG